MQWVVGAGVLALSSTAMAQPGSEEGDEPSAVEPAEPEGDTEVQAEPAATPAAEPAAAPAMAHTEDEHATVGVFIEPLLALFGFYEGDLGVAVSDKVVLAAWGQYFDYELLGVGLTGYGVGVGTQIFPLEKSFKGFYVFPLLKYQRFDIQSSGDSVAKIGYYGPTVTLGYQWNWHPFSLRLGGGVEYSFGEISTNVDAHDVSADLRGFDYELDAAIGLAF